jgi:hypothetical protein
MWGTLKDLKFKNSELQCGFQDKQQVSSDWIYDEVCGTKYIVPNSKLKFVWEEPKGSQKSKLWVESFVLGTKISRQIAVRLIRWNSLNKTFSSTLEDTFRSANIKILNMPV